MTPTPKIYDRRADIKPKPGLVPVEIDEPNPLSGETPDRLIVMRHVRDDPLGWMESQGHVDAAQYLAGRRWQQLYERAEIGSVQALDTSKEPVDGGGIFTDLITDGQRDAVRMLRLADCALEDSWPGDRNRGKSRVQLVRTVLGLGIFDRRDGEAMREFRWCLDVLASSFDWQRH